MENVCVSWGFISGLWRKSNQISRIILHKSLSDTLATMTQREEAPLSLHLSAWTWNVKANRKGNGRLEWKAGGRRHLQLTSDGQTMRIFHAQRKLSLLPASHNFPTERSTRSITQPCPPAPGHLVCVCVCPALINQIPLPLAMTLHSLNPLEEPQLFLLCPKRHNGGIETRLILMRVEKWRLN